MKEILTILSNYFVWVEYREAAMARQEKRHPVDKSTGIMCDQSNIPR